MAFSDSEVHNDKPCTKSCLKNYETLKKQYDDLLAKLHESIFKASTYKRGLDTVEAQLVTYRKNEVLFSEEVVALKREVGVKTYEFNMLKTEFEKVKQEKEGIDFKIEKFENASKDLDKLPGSQITNNSKKGLRVSYKPFEVYGLRANKSVCENSSKRLRNFWAPLIDEWVSDNEDEVEVFCCENRVVDYVSKNIVIRYFEKLDYILHKERFKSVMAWMQMLMEARVQKENEESIGRVPVKAERPEDECLEESIPSKEMRFNSNKLAEFRVVFINLVSNIPKDNSSVQDLWEFVTIGVVVMMVKQICGGVGCNKVYKEAGNEAGDLLSSSYVWGTLGLVGFTDSMDQVEEVKTSKALTGGGLSLASWDPIGVYESWCGRWGKAACLRICINIVIGLMYLSTTEFAYWAPILIDGASIPMSNPLERKGCERVSLDESLEKRAFGCQIVVIQIPPKRMLTMIRCRLLRRGLRVRRMYVGGKNWEDMLVSFLGVHSQGDCGNVTTDDNEDVTPVIAPEKDSIIAPPSTPPGNDLNIAVESGSSWIDYIGPYLVTR
ncbi:hypothetical protein Tco_0336405 [Tanacetum coccineum]